MYIGFGSSEITTKTETRPRIFRDRRDPFSPRMIRFPQFFNPDRDGAGIVRMPMRDAGTVCPAHC